MTNIAIPAGLIDQNIEFFNVGNVPMAIYQGRVHDFDSLPAKIHNIIWDAYSDNAEMMQSLNENGYKSKASKIRKITSCRFGAFDSTSDLENLKINKTEHFDCGFRNSCPMEGIVCSSPTFNDHVINPFEMKLIQLLSTEMTLPAIVDEMKVSTNTLDARKSNLYKKFQVLSRPRLVALAFQNNLIV